MHVYYVGIKAINCGRSEPCQYKASHSIQLSKLENVTYIEISVYLFDSLLYTCFIYKSVHSNTGLPSGAIYLYSTIEIRTFSKGHSAYSHTVALFLCPIICQIY